MNNLSILKEALRTPRRASLRSSLAALGVVMGVAAVVAMVALGEGAKASIEAVLARMDSSRLSVTAFMPAQPPFGLRAERIPLNDGLQIEDFLAVRTSMKSEARAGLRVSTASSPVRSGGHSTTARIIGTEADGLVFEARRVISGSMFGESEVKSGRPVCLVSEFLADLLFAGRNPVGHSLSIGGSSFSILGVVNDVYPRDPGRSDIGDASIIVPYTSVRTRLDREAPVSFSVKANQPLGIVALESRVTRLLEERRGSRKADFHITNVGFAIEAHRQSSHTMSLLLGATAGISLLVGGIGIMNIMLVSVIERTREIGLRVAIGTRRSDVLRQFLFESVVLCVLGGAVGILLGASAAVLMSRLNGWPVLITLQSVMIAFLVSVGTGVAFGYTPARRAASLEPILALRSD
jgi:putative ABC transport system permease protein